MVTISYFQCRFTPWIQDVHWTYIRRSKDVQDILWMSYVHSIYVLCPKGRRGEGSYLPKDKTWKQLSHSEDCRVKQIQISSFFFCVSLSCTKYEQLQLRTNSKSSNSVKMRDSRQAASVQVGHPTSINLLNACVRYFLSDFYFFTKW